jgi:hypothetical protein
VSTHREIEEVYFRDIRRKSKMIKTIGETLGEIQGERKIWVDMEFVETWAKVFAKSLYSDMLHEVKCMLREAGISIKK